MTELQQFLAMLERAGVGHGTREDHKPCGTAVQIESEGQDGPGFMVTEFAFSGDGNLTEVICFKGEEY